jgi:hypothetical protein
MSGYFSTQLVSPDLEFGRLSGGNFYPTLKEREALYVARGFSFPAQRAKRDHLLRIRQDYPARRQEIAKLLREGQKGKYGYKPVFVLD